jgi:hypothetical protein
LLLAPGITFCTGSLISSDTILTAAHCTKFWSELAEAGDLDSIMVSFDPQASVDEDWQPDGGTWYPASHWLTHPDYVDADWPFTFDYGLLYLDSAVGITPRARSPRWRLPAAAQRPVPVRSADGAGDADRSPGRPGLDHRARLIDPSSLIEEPVPAPPGRALL